MRALIITPLWLAACSIDWSLARQAPSAAGGDESGVPNADLLCDGVPPLASAPTLDGTLEPNLSFYSWLESGAEAQRAGVSASLSLAYRTEGLYFFVSVTDPTRDPAPADALAYCGDGVELFVDDDGVIQTPPAYDTPGTMQFVVAAPSEDDRPVRRGERFVYPGFGDAIELGAWTSPRFAAFPTESGYTVEAFIDAGDLDLASWTLAAGGKIGWNLSLNVGGLQDADADACTTRSQQVHFRLAASGTCSAPYCNASAFCATTLTAP